MIMYLYGEQIAYELNYEDYVTDDERIIIGKIIMNIKYCIDDKIFNCERESYENMCYGVLKNKMNDHNAMNVCLLKDFMIFERIIDKIHAVTYRYLKKHMGFENDTREFNPELSNIFEKNFSSHINIADIYKFVSFIDNKELNKFLYEKKYMIDKISKHDRVKEYWYLTYYNNYVIGSNSWSDESKHDKILKEIEGVINKEKFEIKKEEERRQKELEREMARKHIYKYNYVYLITDLTNNKKYIGKHSTNDLDDGYMGSGILLKEAQREKGMDNFKKDILHMCKTEGEAFKMERKEIDKVKAYENDMYYNLV